ncbi:FAD-binding oxidoreductase [bacterium]|nr:FAD-binding oxidoreductase [bacterium]
MNYQVKFTVVGQGLVGSLVALQLLDSGADVQVIDRAPRRCASWVSSGMIDPISGQRFATTWNYHTHAPLAVATYKRLEDRFGIKILRESPIWRLFRDNQDRQTYQKKREKGALDGFIDSEFHDTHHRHIRSPFGGIQVRGGYIVDVEQLTRRLAIYFDTLGILQFGEVANLTNSEQIIIHCTGAYAASTPLFSWLPFRNSRGECIRFTSNELSLPGIINNGFWICPLGNGEFKAGATYSWEDLFSMPKAIEYHQVLDKLRTIIPSVPIHELRVESGTRSIMEDTLPVVGCHPNYPNELIVSGVGSKGTLSAPFLARQVQQFLLNNAEIHPEISIQRFIKKYYFHGHY